MTHVANLIRKANAHLQVAELKRKKHDSTYSLYLERAKKEHELAKSLAKTIHDEDLCFDFELKLKHFALRPDM